ncbi:unnamed protein product [marine sediment metagenome]|uniref:Uncharacterized protein n=1 Tax=marine sediment metagenome TaxID=412755 RepID=X1IS17_9ZZZZ
MKIRKIRNAGKVGIVIAFAIKLAVAKMKPAIANIAAVIHPCLLFIFIAPFYSIRLL